MTGRTWRGCNRWRAAATLLIAGAAPAPVIDADFPDPFVLPVPGGLAAYATNTRREGRAVNVQVSRSADGVRWSALREAMPRAPGWARRREPDIWAPEAIAAGGRYVLFFSARHATKRRPDGLTLCVGAAVADRPEGPFVAQPGPLTCGGEHGAIDASPFRDLDGTLWLYVKTDGNCCGAPIRVIVQKLSADGLRLEGRPTVLDGVTNDAAWEGNVIEAPEMERHGGQYVLFYAGNDYGGDRYALGYAICSGPVGPCVDAAENPILKGGRGVTGPGHQSVFHWRGRDWIAFHGWRVGPPRYRATYIAPLSWEGGRPVVRTGD